METATRDVDTLPLRQRQVLTAIVDYSTVVGEQPTVRGLARRLHVHHSTIQEHLEALARKGWLRSSGSLVCTRPFLRR